MRSTGLTLLLATLLSCAGCASHPPASGIAVARVDFGGSIWSSGQRRSGVCYQDGGQSFAVPGGTVWTFGDTFFGNPPLEKILSLKQAKGAVGCTIGFLPAGEKTLPPALQYITDAKGRVADPLLAAAKRYGLSKKLRMWPGAGITLGSRQYLYFNMIAEDKSKPSPWNFRQLGGGLAARKCTNGTFNFITSGGSWKFPVLPGQALVAGNILYLLEAREKNPQGLVLARVPVGDVTIPSRYQYFDGRHWSSNREAVKAVLRDVWGQVSVVPWDRGWLMATSSSFFQPHQIQLRTAQQPEGPWSEAINIEVPEISGAKTNLVYCTYIHPELSDIAHGRIVLTYCRMLAGQWQLSNPQWIAVTLRPRP